MNYISVVSESTFCSVLLSSLFLCRCLDIGDCIDILTSTLY